jgi:hypothetical protein
MVERSSGILPTMVRILVLAPFPGFSCIYRRYALSSRRRGFANGDFGNLQICLFLKKMYVPDISAQHVDYV